MPHPLFVGDTVYAETNVIAKRDSGSRPNMGIITVRTRGLNQHEQTVIELERSVMVYRRGAIAPGSRERGA